MEKCVQENLERCTNKMEIPPQIPNSPNKCVQRIEKSPQISKLPNKRARDERRESPQISKKPNKRAGVPDASYNPYDHNPNANKSDFYSRGWVRGGLNE